MKPKFFIFIFIFLFLYHTPHHPNTGFTFMMTELLLCIRLLNGEVIRLSSPPSQHGNEGNVPKGRTSSAFSLGRRTSVSTSASGSAASHHLANSSGPSPQLPTAGKTHSFSQFPMTSRQSEADTGGLLEEQMVVDPMKPIARRFRSATVVVSNLLRRRKSVSANALAEQQPLRKMNHNLSLPFFILTD
jgi:hypothetical protein